MKKISVGILIFVVLIGSLYVLTNFWSYLFAKTIDGRVIKVEKLMDSIALVGPGAAPSSKVFSFAVAIRNEATGEIFTASSEDRQWAAVEGDNLCAEAKFFPYPPWHFDKSGTYFGARLLRLWSCSDKKPL